MQQCSFRIVLDNGSQFAVMLKLVLQDSYDLYCSVPDRDEGEIARWSYHKDGNNHVYAASGSECPAGLPLVPPAKMMGVEHLVTWVWTGNFLPLKWSRFRERWKSENQFIETLLFSRYSRSDPLIFDIWMSDKAVSLGEGSNRQYLATHQIPWNKHSIIVALRQVGIGDLKNDEFCMRTVSIIADSVKGRYVAYSGTKSRPGFADPTETISGTPYGRAFYAQNLGGGWSLGRMMGPRSTESDICRPVVAMDVLGNVRGYVADGAGHIYEENLY